MASQWKMIWWRFKKHRLAVASGIILIFMYATTLIVEIMAPYELHTRNTNFIYAPPQSIHLFHDGSFEGPFVYRLDYHLNMENLKREYTVNPDKIDHLRFFCLGDSYSFWGLIDGSFHLICPSRDGTMFLYGTDRLGRDMFSRILYGSRISLTVGLFGIAFSFLLGISIGGAAGYFGGWVDATVQRMIEVLRSLPELTLWMALSAALPITWSPILVFFGITIILGMLDWPGLARAVRSKLLALREEDYCSAAILMGASPGRVIARHLLPNFTSHLI